MDLKLALQYTRWKRVFIGLAVFLTVVFVAVLGYVIAGWTFLEAVYMVIITITSVGFGEVKPIDSPGLMLFTIFVVIIGTGTSVYVLGALFQMVAEGEIKQALGARRVARGINQIKDHTIVCGFGRMGQMLARELAQAKHPFLVIENDADRLIEAREQGYLYISGDATDEKTLQAARLDKACSLALTLPNDAANVFITLSARNLNPKLTILARGEIPSTEAKLKQAGANHVVLPPTIGGVRMAHMIVRPSAAHLLSSPENLDTLSYDLEQLGIQINQIHIPKQSMFTGKSLREVEIVGNGAYLIVAIRRADGSLVRKPRLDFTLEPDDTAIIVGHGEEIPEFSVRTSPGVTASKQRAKPRKHLTEA